MSSGSAGAVTTTPTETPPGPPVTDSLSKIGDTLLTAYGAAGASGVTLSQLMVMALLPGRYQEMAFKAGCPQQNILGIINNLKCHNLAIQAPEGFYQLTQTGKNCYDQIISKINEITEK